MEHYESQASGDNTNEDAQKFSKDDQSLGMIQGPQISVGSEQYLPAFRYSSSSQTSYVSDPLQYINPAIFCNREGQFPFVMGGGVLKPSREQQYKTVLCKDWLTNGYCYYGDECLFAHGETERRQTLIRPVPRNPRLLKTKLCYEYTNNGVCPYGNQCFFIHPDPRNPLNSEIFNISHTGGEPQHHSVAQKVHSDHGLRSGFSASVPSPNSRLPSTSQSNPMMAKIALLRQMILHNFDAKVSLSSKSLSPKAPPSSPCSLREQLEQQLKLSEAKEQKLAARQQQKKKEAFTPFNSLDFSRSLKSDIFEKK